MLIFTKKLFKAEPDNGVKLDENFWEEEDKITILENSLLEAPFTEQEIRIAVFDSYSDGAPSPDGFSFMFYQSFWDLIKDDFMKLVKEFEFGGLNLDRLNYPLITLIPKEPNAKLLKKFSLLVCLIVVSKFLGRLLLIDWSRWLIGLYLRTNLLLLKEDSF
jgi:hypothetical protein